MKELYFQSRVMMCIWAHLHTWARPFFNIKSRRSEWSIWASVIHARYSWVTLRRTYKLMIVMMRQKPIQWIEGSSYWVKLRWLSSLWILQITLQWEIELIYLSPNFLLWNVGKVPYCLSSSTGLRSKARKSIILYCRLNNKKLLRPRMFSCLSHYYCRR